MVLIFAIAFTMLTFKGWPACLLSSPLTEYFQETPLCEIDILYCIKTNKKRTKTDFLITWPHTSKLASQAVIQHQPHYFKHFLLKKSMKQQWPSTSLGFKYKRDFYQCTFEKQTSCHHQGVNYIGQSPAMTSYCNSLLILQSITYGPPKCNSKQGCRHQLLADAPERKPTNLREERGGH